MWNLKVMAQMNLFAKRNKSHKCRKLTWLRGKGGGMNGRLRLTCIAIKIDNEREPTLCVC